MQCALLPGLIWKDARDSVHQPSAFLSSPLLPFRFHHRTIISFQVFLFTLVLPLHILLSLTSLRMIPFLTTHLPPRPPYVSHFLLSLPVSLGLVFSRPLSELALSLCACVCACMPHYKALADQKQACISGGHCVPWPHPHSALGYSVWV